MYVFECVYVCLSSLRMLFMLLAHNLMGKKCIHPLISAMLRHFRMGDTEKKGEENGDANGICVDAKIYIFVKFYFGVFFRENYISMQ